MRVALKGVNRTRKRLADGRLVTYYYAWKGGPPLEGAFGSAEFHASYAKAWAGRGDAASDVLRFVFDQFRVSPDFARLAPRTQKDYSKHLLRLEQEFGDLPLAAMEDRRIRGDLLAWRDSMAAKSRRQADYAFAVLARTLAWARNRGLIAVNPCERGGRVYRADRSGQVWSPQQERALNAAAPPHLRLALSLALWTGQRQGDLLRLRWKDYDGDAVRLRQSKSGVAVTIPVSSVLRRELDALQPDAVRNKEPGAAEATILVTERGSSWTEGGFRASWRKVCLKAGISGVTFHDLRGTAVTRLAQAGCTVPQIATITGHSLADVGAILDRHYLNRSSDMARSAIEKLEQFSAELGTIVAADGDEARAQPE